MTNSTIPYINTYPHYQTRTPATIPPTTPLQKAQAEQLQNASQYIKSYVTPQINRAQPSQQKQLNDPVINAALSKLKEVKFLPGDFEYMKKLGVNPIFNNGEEAIKLIKDKGIKVEFGKVDSSKTHAQWEKDSNRIIINDKYKNIKIDKDEDKAVILAISEAMFHEAGHAKDNDNISSVQEEFDCLALNTLANRYHQNTYPDVFKNAGNADILNDGVDLYTKLFFDPDPDKKALTQRIIKIYGSLDLESPNHKSAINSIPAMVKAN